MYSCQLSTLDITLIKYQNLSGRKQQLASATHNKPTEVIIDGALFEIHIFF